MVKGESRHLWEAAWIERIMIPWSPLEIFPETNLGKNRLRV